MVIMIDEVDKSMKVNNKSKSPKDKIIDRMFNVIQGQAMIVREDRSISDKERLAQTDVLLNMMKFLKDYDDNVKILNAHKKPKYTEEQMKQIEKEDMGYPDR